MEEEEVLGVNLDELSSLFTSPEFLGGRSFGWGLSPYKNIVVADDGAMQTDDSVVLFIDAFGEANLNSKMWMYQKADPLDAYVEPEFSTSNKFIQGLQKSVGVPTYGIIAYPWYEIADYDTGKKLKEIRYPNDTPAGFVPCSGYKIKINGRDFTLPNLVSRIITTGAGDDAVNTIDYIAPPGCTMMIKLPGTIESATSQSLFRREEDADFTGKLRIWGNPESPFSNSFGFG
tara:strand:- start:332 stop:1024 length:693 start_codon:yes stop_codon:yes gene_type:complete